MSLTEQLRAAIAASGKTHYRLGQESGIAPHVIDRFVSGERSLNWRPPTNSPSRWGWP